MTEATLIQTCLLLGVFVPLASFVFLAIFGTRLGGGRNTGYATPTEGVHQPAEPGRGEPIAGWVATAAIGFSLVMAIVSVVTWYGADADAHARWTQQAADGAVRWTDIGPIPVSFGVNLDSLTVIMFLMVALCSTCIHIFSVGYMKGEPRFAWFFAFLSLFCFSMLGLVIARSLLFLFIFWELVGLCSYFLIGFWFEKKSASDAAIKAFVVNRVGDFGFIIGLALCFIYLDTFSLERSAAVFEAGAHAAGAVHGGLSEGAAAVSDDVVASASRLFTTSFWGVPLATWMGICLFCGAIGKSAQFPLHVWLPDAMEGPTPVSALIHAATMVAAGVYLVARIFLLLTPGAQLFIAVIGCITLTMAALIAIVQLDIKRVLAYSTLSQLGYMVFAMGVGAWIAALFHLLVHAFFKALLFLGSGQVIIGCHHQQDMRPMGGLRSKMPWTALTFFVAVLAISGVGIPWTQFGIGGFYSKDEILVVAHHRAFDWGSHGEASHAALSEASLFGDSMRGNHTRGAADFSPRGLAQTEIINSSRLASSNGLRVVPVSFQEHGHGEPAPAGKTARTEVRGSSGNGDAEAHGTDYAGQYPGVHRLPFILFLLPVIVAYITPFYMGRCFILTFMGKPRDKHLHEHAHETILMYGPLIILAIMTLISGVLLFRPLVAESVPATGVADAVLHGGPLVPAINGKDHALGQAHHALPPWVGFSWIVGLGIAYLCYRNGFAFAERVRKLPVVRPVYAVLWNKFYFDHVYNFVWVGGCKALAVICRLFDNWIIDGIVNNSARLTERISRFSGVVLDNMGIDGLVNLVGYIGWTLGGLFRAVQTGAVRNYILLAVVGISGVLICILTNWSVTWAVVWVVVIVAALLLPWSLSRRQATGER